MIKTFLLAILTCAVALAVYLFFYLGFYKTVEIAVGTRGPLYLLYKAHTGAYHEIGPTIHEVENWARSQKLMCIKTFGEYLDNPETVDQDRLRSRGGCVLDAPLKQIPPQFQYEERSVRSYAVGHFSGSPAIAPMKVYPKAKEFLAERHLKAKEAVIETYVINGAKVEVEYLFALDPSPP